jgi:hypothetical protein
MRDNESCMYLIDMLGKEANEDSLITIFRLKFLVKPFVRFVPKPIPFLVLFCEIVHFCLH